MVATTFARAFFPIQTDLAILCRCSPAREGSRYDGAGFHVLSPCSVLPCEAGWRQWLATSRGGEGGGKEVDQDRGLSKVLVRECARGRRSRAAEPLHAGN